MLYLHGGELGKDIANLFKICGPELGKSGQAERRKSVAATWQLCMLERTQDKRLRSLNPKPKSKSHAKRGKGLGGPQPTSGCGATDCNVGALTMGVI